jgi:hypothetical protein
LFSEEDGSVTGLEGVFGAFGFSSFVADCFCCSFFFLFFGTGFFVFVFDVEEEDDEEDDDEEEGLLGASFEGLVEAFGVFVTVSFTGARF